jgi:hypothetical protein
MTAPLPERIAAAIDRYGIYTHDDTTRGLTIPCSRTLAARDDLISLFAEVVAERDALRSELDAALLVLPACCGSLADAADTLRQDRDAEQLPKGPAHGRFTDAERAEMDALKRKAFEDAKPEGGDA